MTKSVLAFIFLFVSFLGCTDPVTPEFEFQEGLIFVEGFISTLPGGSFVTVSKSAIEFEVYVVRFQEGASVSFENLESGETVLLTETEETYLAPTDFKAQPGEEWKLVVNLANGVRYESRPEKVLEPVAIVDIEARYDTELEFREIYGGKFVPGHEVFVSLDDPADKENYYYWTYKTYENLNFCQRCFAGYYRDGGCKSFPTSVSGIPYYDYLCDSDCWRIRFPESIAIYDDKFADGLTVNNISIGNLLLYTKENMVVVVQQLALTPEAHKYYEILKDLVDNKSGINAPPPAGLVGNLFNPENDEDFVFGRFTAAASSEAFLFIDRSEITEDPLENRGVNLFEKADDPVPAPVTTIIACSENRFRTPIQPPGWVNQ
ncbi:MAG: DUF4249 domain-containing protein [Maribacter sp.]